MKNKGFTLIELLAVIVILAIIALIATPVILGIIEDARTSAAERSAELVKSGVQNAYTGYMMKNNGVAPSKVGEYMAESAGFFTVDSVTVAESVTTSSTEVEVTTDDNVTCTIAQDTTDSTQVKVACAGSFPEVKTDDDKYVKDAWDSGNRTYYFTASLKTN
ncbi:MAG: prepilin-type N-terminal cleavage/methylation domain-containing protein [Firmicutes bacterium]|nr:prepilin-type N-terminal cleavage/methylation domain-containing protein [Bacillota bacterium]